MCRSWSYKAVNPPLRKADHLSLAIGDTVCGYIATEYSYKTSCINKLGNAVVPVKSGFPFSSHPLSHVRVDAIVKFSCYGNGFSIREQISQLDQKINSNFCAN